MKFHLRLNESALLHYAPHLKPWGVLVGDIKVRNGKLWLRDFGIIGKLGGYDLRVKPVVPRMPVRNHLALELGVGKIGSRNILFRAFDGLIRSKFRHVPRVSYSRGRVIINLSPLEIVSVSAQDKVLKLVLKYQGKEK